MGYPMTYPRIVNRNHLQGDYGNNPGQPEKGSLDLIRGDLRRLEKDQRDDSHVQAYSKAAGITAEQARRMLDLFFAGTVDGH